MVDTCRKDKGKKIKDKVVLPTGGGEATEPEKMEALYESVRSWVTEKEDNIPFPYWKEVG